MTLVTHSHPTLPLTTLPGSHFVSKHSDVFSVVTRKIPFHVEECSYDQQVNNCIKIIQKVQQGLPQESLEVNDCAGLHAYVSRMDSAIDTIIFSPAMILSYE